MRDELKETDLEGVVGGLSKPQSACLVQCAAGCAAKCVVPVAQAQRAVNQAARGR